MLFELIFFHTYFLNLLIDLLALSLGGARLIVFVVARVMRLVAVLVIEIDNVRLWSSFGSCNWANLLLSLSRLGSLLLHRDRTAWN